MTCDRKRGRSAARSHWTIGWIALLLASLAVPQAALSQSGKKAEADKKTSTSKSKTPHAAKTDAVPKGDASSSKPTTEAAPAVPAPPETAAAPNPPDATVAEPKPAAAPAPAAQAAPAVTNEPGADAASEQAKSAALEELRNKLKAKALEPIQPAADPAQTPPSSEPAVPASPSLAGSSPVPAPAETAKPPLPEAKPSLPEAKPPLPEARPSPAPSAAEPAAAPETNPVVPAGEAVPSGAATASPSGPAEQASEPPQQTTPPQAPAPAACNRADFRMAIDVGHTETNYGAVSAHGKPEYDFNRRLARDLATKLWSNGFERAEVVIQTDSDLARRSRDLSSRRPNLMLSLHHDSVQDKYLRTAELDGQMRTFTEGFRGYSIFVSHDNSYRDDSDRFARMLGGEMLAQGLKPTFHHHEQENRPILDGQTGVFLYDGLAVLRQTTAPAVLLESAVITNPEDEAKADDPAYRNRITNAIVAAVTKFCDAAATARAQPRATPPLPLPKPAPSDKPGSRK